MHILKKISLANEGIPPDTVCGVLWPRVKYPDRSGVPPIHVPFIAKQPPVMFMPLAKVEVAAVPSMLNTVAAIFPFTDSGA